MTEDGELTVDAANGLLTNDTDEDDGNASLTVSRIIADPADGTLAVNGDGSFTYTPRADFSGEDAFVYEVSDGANTSEGTARISVAEEINIAVIVSAIRSVIVPGGDPVATFKVTATNSGPSDASGVTISQTSVLPAGIMITNGEPTSGSFADGLWTLALADGESETLTVFLQAAETVASNVSEIDFAVALTGSDQADSTPANNTSSATVSIANTDDFEVTVTEAPAVSQQSGLFVSKVTVTNTTGSTISAQRLFVTGLPADVTVHNATGSDSFGALPAGTRTCCPISILLREPLSSSPWSFSGKALIRISLRNTRWNFWRMTRLLPMPQRLESQSSG